MNRCYVRVLRGASGLRGRIGALSVVVAVGVVGGLSVPVAHADVTSVGGGASGYSLQLLSTLQGAQDALSATIALTPSVTAPANGAAQQDGANDIIVTGNEGFPGNAIQIGSIGAATVTSAGGQLGSHAGFLSSTSTVQDVALLPNDFGGITAASIEGRCTANGDGASAAITLTDVVVFGTPIPTNAPPVVLVPLQFGNETVNATVVVNEQQAASAGGQFANISVNALHVTAHASFQGGTFVYDLDLVLGQAVCQVNGPDVLQGPGAEEPEPSTTTTTTVPAGPTSTPPTSSTTTAAPTTSTSTTIRGTGSGRADGTGAALPATGRSTRPLTLVALIGVALGCLLVVASGRRRPGRS